mgnify:CR=1 FL=1
MKKVYVVTFYDDYLNVFGSHIDACEHIVYHADGDLDALDRFSIFQQYIRFND